MLITDYEDIDQWPRRHIENYSVRSHLQSKSDRVHVPTWFRPYVKEETSSTLNGFACDVDTIRKNQILTSPAGMYMSIG